ncbi:concanavalin A-like lectin/glucanase domain-containing protein [Syncephalis fuscata]|nr:concanavalin A-like lectin/glucanase domain-containing protein [Syncephalis fuscata]
MILLACFIEHALTKGGGGGGGGRGGGGGSRGSSGSSGGSRGSSGGSKGSRGSSGSTGSINSDVPIFPSRSPTFIVFMTPSSHRTTSGLSNATEIDAGVPYYTNGGLPVSPYWIRFTNENSQCTVRCQLVITIGSICSLSLLVVLGRLIFIGYKTRLNKNKSNAEMTQNGDSSTIFAHQVAPTTAASAGRHSAAAIEEGRVLPSYDHVTQTQQHGDGAMPPSYNHLAQTQQHEEGLINEAPTESYYAALAFIRNHPQEPIPDTLTLPEWKTYNFAPISQFSVTIPSGVSVTDEGRVVTFSQPQDTSVLSAYPIPSEATSALAAEQSTPITTAKYYYEVEIIHKLTRDSTVAIGFASQPYPPFRLVGWEPTSVGYHSDDGRKFYSDAGGGMDYAAGYREGDVIGCGYDPATGGVYYTRNGMHLGVAFSNVRAPALYPCVSADGECTLDISFNPTSLPSGH